MKTISHVDLRNNSAVVMDAVEAGEIHHITRNGAEGAELRPIRRRRGLSAEELVERHRSLPRVDPAQLRADVSEFPGDEDAVGLRDDPFERGCA